MPYNPYNPYNPYGTPNYGSFQQPQPQPQKPTFDFVNGVEGAKSYQVMPNSAAFLFDNENSACYIKTANGFGQASIEYYKVSKCSESDIRGAQPQAQQFATAEQFASIDARIKALEESLKPKEEK